MADDMAWGRVHSPFDVVLTTRRNGTPTSMKRYDAGWEGSLPRSHLETGVAKGAAVEIERPAGAKTTKGGKTVKAAADAGAGPDGGGDDGVKGTEPAASTSEPPPEA